MPRFEVHWRLRGKKSVIAKSEEHAKEIFLEYARDYIADTLHQHTPEVVRVDEVRLS